MSAYTYFMLKVSITIMHCVIALCDNIIIVSYSLYFESLKRTVDTCCVHGFR